MRELLYRRAKKPSIWFISISNKYS